MSFPFADVFGFGTKVLETIFPDPVKRAEAQTLLQTAQDSGRLQELTFDTRQEVERTTRHTNDMQSDNKLSKNIRPATLIFLLLVVTVLALTDGNLQWTYEVAGEIKVWTMAVKPAYVELYQALLMIFAGFYATGRSAEKITKIIKG